MVTFHIGGKSFKLRHNLTQRERDLLERPWSRSLQRSEQEALFFAGLNIGPGTGRDDIFNELMVAALVKCFVDKERIEQLTVRQRCELFLNLLEYHNKNRSEL